MSDSTDDSRIVVAPRTDNTLVVEILIVILTRIKWFLMTFIDIYCASSNDCRISTFITNYMLIGMSFRSLHVDLCKWRVHFVHSMAIHQPTIATLNWNLKFYS